MKDNKTNRTPLIIFSLLLLTVAVFLIIAILSNRSDSGTRKYIVGNEIKLGSIVESEVPATPTVEVEVLPPAPVTPVVDAEVIPIAPALPTIDSEVTPVDIEINIEIKREKNDYKVIAADVNAVGSELKSLYSEVLLTPEHGEPVSIRIPRILVYGIDSEDKSYEIKPEVNVRQIQPGVLAAEVVFSNVNGKTVRIISSSYYNVGNKIEAEVLEQAIEGAFVLVQHYAEKNDITFEVLSDARENTTIKAEVLIDIEITDESGNKSTLRIPAFRRVGKEPVEKSYNMKAQVLEGSKPAFLISEILLSKSGVSVPEFRRVCHEDVYPPYEIEAEVLTNPLNPGFKYTNIYKLYFGMRVEVEEKDILAEVILDAVVTEEETGKEFKVDIPDYFRRIGDEPAEKPYDIAAQILEKKLQPVLEITLLYSEGYDITGEVLETKEEQYEAPEILPEVLVQVVIEGVKVEIPEIRRVGDEPAEKPYEIEAVVDWSENRPMLAEVVPYGQKRYGITAEIREVMLADVTSSSYEMIADILIEEYETYEIKSEILANPFGIAPEILAPTDNPYGIKAELLSNQYGMNPEILDDGSYKRDIKAEVIKYEYDMPYKMESELLIGPESEGSEFGVIDVRFSDSQILTDEYLHQLKRKSLNDYEGMEALTHILNDINNEYISRGYPNAYAYLPEQVVDDGVFYIKLIEGVIGKVILENNKYTNDVYILSHFDLEPGDLFDISELEYQLMLFNKWAQGVAVTARLEPGDEEGSTDIILTAHEVYPNEVSIYGDNYGTAGYGEYRLGASVSMNSLTKNRDILAYGATLTQGSFNLFADYSLLTPKHDIRLGIKGTYGQSTVATVYQEYNIKGESRSYGLYTTIPLQRTLSTQSTFNLSGSYSYAKSSALNPEIIISEEVITNITCGLGHIVTTDNIYAYVSTNLTFGLPYYDTLSDYLKVDSMLGFRIGDLFGFYLTGKTQVQFVLDSGDLPKSLDMQVGGSSTVRGYKERCAWGREGVLGNLEFHIGFEPGVLDVFGFLDYAYIRPYPDTGENYMISAGVGANITVAKHFDISFAAGFPQIALTVQDPDATKGGRIHLGMSFNF